MNGCALLRVDEAGTVIQYVGFGQPFRRGCCWPIHGCRRMSCLILTRWIGILNMNIMATFHRRTTAIDDDARLVYPWHGSLSIATSSILLWSVSWSVISRFSFLVSRFSLFSLGWLFASWFIRIRLRWLSCHHATSVAYRWLSMKHRVYSWRSYAGHSIHEWPV